MADYPSGVYSPRTKANKSGVVYDPLKTTVGYAEDITKLDAEAVAIETELGTNPKGAKADVKTRLDDVDTLLGTHKTRHQNGGDDEISVAGLSGELADNQPPKTHASSHNAGGSDVLTGESLEIKKVITIIMDGAGAVLETGIKAAIWIPFDCEILGAVMLADQSGSAVVDIWKDSWANYPPTDADSITSSTPPTITTATKSIDVTLTSWTKSLAYGNTLIFNLDSVTDIERLTVQLLVKMVAS